MPNSVQFSETAVDDVLKVSNLYIAAPASGPTSVSGFYAGINPPSGGYTVYMNKASGGPSIVCPANDAALVAFTENLTGESMADVNACFAYFAGETDKMVMHNPINGLITDSLVAYFAPGAIPSYPRSGTTMYDLGSEGHNATLENGGTFNSNGWLNLDGVDDEITLSGATSLIQQKTAITLCILFRMETLGNLKGLLGTSNYSCTKNLGLVASNANLQFYNDTTTCMNTATSIVETGKWIYAVGTYDGTTTKIRGFKEGAMQSGQTDTKSGATNSFTSEFQILGANHSGFFTDGDVARASVYQKVLTEAEILQNYHQAAIVTDGLVFAADAGNLMSYTPDNTDDAQDLVSSYVGTLTNGVAFSSESGGTWVFDGVNDRINFDGATILGYIGVTSGNDNDVAYSMEAWIKLDAYPSGVGGFGDTIMGHNSSQGIGLQAFGTGTTAYINFGYRSNSNEDSSNITINEWHHVVGTRAVGGAIKIYIDGVEDFSKASGNLAVDYSTDDFAIGHAPNRIGPFNGDISSTRVYNKSLTAAEVAQNYNANVNKFN